MSASSMAVERTSIRDALDSATIAIGASGSESPRLDAEVLLACILDADRARLLRDADESLPVTAIRPFQDAVRRRSVGREPVAYITGYKDFRRIVVAVDPRVLIPRPETELLVEVGLELPAGTRVHDAGTGSGAVALALKQERPDLIVSASDISPDAISVACANRDRLGLEVQLDVAGWSRAFDDADAVLCNPPYVGEDERQSLPAELSHEPPGALFAGRDGLDAIRALADVVQSRRAALQIALEVGAGQARQVALMLEAAGCSRTATRRDLAGIERVVLAWRS